jgi:hypothetical protein
MTSALASILRERSWSIVNLAKNLVFFKIQGVEDIRHIAGTVANIPFTAFRNDGHCELGICLLITGHKA